MEIMEQNRGFVKLHRKFTEWGWYSDVNVKVTFLHLLLNANHKDKEYMGHTIKRGELIVGTKTTPLEIGITPQQFRTAIKKLEQTGEITKKSTNKFTVITIEKYNEYQLDTTKDNKQITNEQQTDNKRATNEQQHLKNVKNVKNDKNVKNIYIQPPLGEMENVLLTDEEFEKLKNSYYQDYQDYIEQLSLYLSSTGKKYKSHYSTILAWMRKANVKKSKYISEEEKAEREGYSIF